MSILKGPHVLTPKRRSQAERDFAHYRRPAASTPPQPLPEPLPDPRPVYGMPNRHCPGSVALALLGGKVWGPLEMVEIMK
jgi:hypothetical protein